MLVRNVAGHLRRSRHGAVAGCTRCTPPRTSLQLRLLSISSSATRAHDYALTAADDESVTLTAEQNDILQRVLKGENVCMLGPGGTGKSLLIRRMARQLRAKHAADPAAVAVTAMTGIAAELIGGKTLHSWGRISSMSLGRPQVRGDASVRATKCLILDEVSMLDASLLETLDQSIRKIRGNQRPFGGMQVVFAGDFFQLPPVTQQPLVLGPRLSSIPSYQRFAFEAPVYSKLFGANIFQLETIHRQSGTEFQSILNKIRVNESLTSAEHALLTEDRDLGGMPSLRIFATNKEVHSYTHREFELLPARPFTSAAVDWINRDYSAVNSYFYQTFTQSIPTQLVLKEGMPVMSTINVSGTKIRNGSRGLLVAIMDTNSSNPQAVVRFPVSGGHCIEHRFGQHTFHLNMRTVGEADAPVADWTEEATWSTPYSVQGSGELVSLAWRKQFPLRPVWASTIHKVQGQTLESAHVDLAKVFTEHQVYVALSRCKSLERLVVKNFSPSRVLINPTVAQFREKLLQRRCSLG